MLSKDDLRQSKRAQLTVLGVFFVTCFSILFYLEGKMEKFEKELEFGYREFYQRPFHYMLDPFTYVGLKDGIPVTELEPPNPNYKLSYEELLVTRFIDYYVWSLGGSSEIDSTFTRPRIDQTIEAFDGYVRNRLYYRLGREELDINPILLKDPAMPPNTGNFLVFFCHYRKCLFVSFRLRSQVSRRARKRKAIMEHHPLLHRSSSGGKSSRIRQPARVPLCPWQPP
jgi:hypothetical protein